MARLPNRGTTQRAPGTAREFPAFPNFDPQFAEIDGGKTNAAIQRWNALMRQRLEGNEAQDNGRFRNIQTTLDRSDGYLESVWTMQAIAGPVVTGMTLFSASGPDTTISRITFQADVFQIQTASGNHKTVFTTTADAIKLGDVLTVDLANAKVYIGTGTYANANTPFYVDDDGYFSLMNKLTFDPTGAGTLTVSGTIVATAGSIGGWDINATTISKNNAILDSTGQLVLGTASDILYLSAVDATYRIWAGNVTAALATFSVTKAGALFSTSGSIGGYAITANSLIAGTGATTISLSNAAATGLTLGDPAAARVLLRRSIAGTPALFLFNAANTQVVDLEADVTSSSGYLRISKSTGTDYIEIDGGKVFTTPTIAWNGDALANLYRSGAGVLKTDGAFTISGTATLSSGFAATGTCTISSGGLATDFVQSGDGSVSAPGYRFGSDTDTGIWLSAAGTMNFVTSGASRLIVRDAAIVCLVPLKLDNARVPGVPVPGGVVTMQDSTGGTISVITT